MRIFWLVVCLVLFAVGCQRTLAPEPISPSDLTYFEDSRTGLCFAALGKPTKAYPSATSPVLRLRSL